MFDVFDTGAICERSTKFLVPRFSMVSELDKVSCMCLDGAQRRRIWVLVAEFKVLESNLNDISIVLFEDAWIPQQGLPDNQPVCTSVLQILPKVFISFTTSKSAAPCLRRRADTVRA